MDSSGRDDNVPYHSLILMEYGIPIPVLRE